MLKAFFSPFKVLKDLTFWIVQFQWHKMYQTNYWCCLYQFVTQALFLWEKCQNEIPTDNAVMLPASKMWSVFLGSENIEGRGGNFVEPIPPQWHLLTPLGNKPLENTLGKWEIARYEQFLLFPQCFQPVWITFCHFGQIWNCRLQTLSVWKSLKFVVW